MTQRDEDRWMKRNYGVIDFELGETKETSKLHLYIKDVDGNTVLRDTLTKDNFKGAKSVPDVDSYLECKKNQAKLYPAKEILYWRLKDWTHPLTQAIYCGVAILGLLVFCCAWCCIKTLVAFCRSLQTSHPTTEKKDD